jgi:hypothetical protein
VAVTVNSAACVLRHAAGLLQFAGRMYRRKRVSRCRTGALRERRHVMVRDFIADVINFFIDLLDRFLAIFGIDI